MAAEVAVTFARESLMWWLLILVPILIAMPLLAS